MKKKFFTLILSICFVIIPCILTGCTKPATIEFKITNGYIQYYNGETWSNLINIEDLKGQNGENGQNGQNGNNGNGIKSITINNNTEKTNSTQTTYIITFDDYSTYEFVVKNGENGQNGQNGIDATYSTYTITYDYGKATTFFETQKTSATIKSTEWITTLPQIKPAYKDFFIGWFIPDTNRQINKYDFIGGDVTLEARFDFEKLANVGFTGLFQNGKYAMDWEDLKTAYPDAIVDGKILSNNGYSYFENLFGDLVMDKEITNITDDAFQFCDKLTSIRLSKNLKTIGSSAFWDCDGLTSLTIPASVTEIVYNAFRSCDKLTSIVVEKENTVYDSRENCNAIIQTSTNSLIFGCCKTIIPTSVTTIAYYAFMENHEITSIIIPSNVETIEYSAFRSCSNLKTIILSKNVTNINSYAFGEHCGIKNVYYLGTSSDWDRINIANNNNFDNATIYYFIENQQDLPNDNGNYWHFDIDGTTPIVW